MAGGKGKEGKRSKSLTGSKKRQKKGEKRGRERGRTEI